MLLKKSTKPAVREVDHRIDDRWLLADLEAAQRRNLYAAGRGDGRDRSSRRRRRIVRAKHS